MLICREAAPEKQPCEVGLWHEQAMYAGKSLVGLPPATLCLGACCSCVPGFRVHNVGCTEVVFAQECVSTGTLLGVTSPDAAVVC